LFCDLLPTHICLALIVQLCTVVGLRYRLSALLGLRASLSDVVIAVQLA